MYNTEKANVTITNCDFTDNHVSERGGGLYNRNSSPIVANSTFSDNSASSGGGAVFNIKSGLGTHIPQITNCVFYDNNSYWGGAIRNFQSSPKITNCTFWGNIAKDEGGAIHDYLNSGICEPEITNCILWGNTPDQIHDSWDCTAIVRNSDIQGGWNGIGNINQNPQFVDSGNRDFHLMPTSPCIDLGSNAVIETTGVTNDFEGDPRIINGIVDMGYDEYFVWSCLHYDSNQSGKIEYGEMVDAFVDYLTSNLKYSHTVDVLMCYLTG